MAKLHELLPALKADQCVVYRRNSADADVPKLEVTALDALVYVRHDGCFALQRVYKVEMVWRVDGVLQRRGALIDERDELEAVDDWIHDDH